MLEADIRRCRERKPILLMTHIVLGYPTLDDSRRLVETMIEAGVDLIELQIPFSEPIADGPVILHANQRALGAGATVGRCFETAARLAADAPIPLLFMTYCNIPFVMGFERFARETRSAGIRGAIVPDLPPEEGDGLFTAMEREGVDPIFIYSPSTSAHRMKAIAARARGFVYCVARKGVTGADSNFASLDAYLAHCREATSLPLAVGFGVKERADVEQLVGKADIAVVGSETIRVVERQGVAAAAPFLRSLVG
ncbi:MAG TPA: tryptophan synthase subunit alpha [Polyangia bacterium]|nr:tryptophan synthase subunit alpha [Polyangia bacterium]